MKFVDSLHSTFQCDRIAFTDFKQSDLSDLNIAKSRLSPICRCLLSRCTGACVSSSSNLGLTASWGILLAHATVPISPSITGLDPLTIDSHNCMMLLLQQANAWHGNGNWRFIMPLEGTEFYCTSKACQGRFKNVYDVVNLTAPKYSILNENCLFQCMGKIFCVGFQNFPLKFHKKYLTNSLEGVLFINK